MSLVRATASSLQGTGSDVCADLASVADGLKTKERDAILHGAYLVLGYITQPVRNSIAKIFKLDINSNLSKLLNVIVTFHLVVFAWIFFRANGIRDSYTLVKNTFSFDMADLNNLNLFRISSDWAISLATIFLLLVVDFITERSKIRHYFNQLPGLLRWALVIFTLAVIVFLGKFEEQDFLYFQF